jgi:hypothetical protein
MTEQLTQLNDGQSLIYSNNNIARAFPDFDLLDIAGKYRDEDQLIITRNDGTNQSLPVANIRKAFEEFTTRLPNFFAYLGPDYRGPSIWRNNCYVILKGHHYQRQGSAKLYNAVAQRRWIDKFIMLQEEQALDNVLQQFDLGYVISPDGKSQGRLNIGIPTDDEDEQEQQEPKPYCSCGSFKRQEATLHELQQEIPGYQPTCKHMAWFKKFREFCVKRSELLTTCRGNVASDATAWYYAPPAIGQQHGKFSIIYTKHGQMAPLNKWRHYKPDQNFNENDVWNLFDSMLENGFVPFPSSALPSISHAFKNA